MPRPRLRAGEDYARKRRGFALRAMPGRSERLPYYPWYVLDYRASFRVQRLTWKARAIYREVLDECWVKGHVPDDMEALALICRCDVKDIAEHWRHIKPLLREVPGSGGALLESPRMEAERAEAGKRSERAQRAANIRWAKPMDAPACDRMPSEHIRTEQNKAVGGAYALHKPPNCTCEPSRDVAPGTGTVFLRHADDCPAH